MDHIRAVSEIIVIAELRSIPGMGQRRVISPSYFATIPLTQVSALTINVQ